MSLISEYFKEASQKEHPSGNDVSIPPMLFDNNQDCFKKKRQRKIIFLIILLLLIVSYAGYYSLATLQQPQAKHIARAEKILITKPINLPLPVKVVKPSEHVLAKVEKLTININKSVLPYEADFSDNYFNDTGFKENATRAGYKLYFTLGFNAQANKQYVKAKKYYEKSLDLNPDYKKSLMNLSSVYIKLNDNNKATILLEKLGRIDPDNIKVFINLGVICLKQKNFRKAEKLFKNVIRKEKNNIVSLYNLAMVYQKTGQLDKAVLTYKRIVKINPGTIKARLACSGIYEEQGQYAKAVENYKKCIKISKKKPRTLNYALRQKIFGRIKLIKAIMAADT